MYTGKEEKQKISKAARDYWRVHQGVVGRQESVAGLLETLQLFVLVSASLGGKRLSLLLMVMQWQF